MLNDHLFIKQNDRATWLINEYFAQFNSHFVSQQEHNNSKISARGRCTKIIFTDFERSTPIFINDQL